MQEREPASSRLNEVFLKIRSRTARLTVMLLLTAAFLTGCIKGTPLAARNADRSAVSGAFDLMLYGCRYPNDLETAAFLVDPEKAGQFELYVMDGSYKVIKGLPAATAFAQAESFVHCGVRTVEKTVVQSIPDAAGGTIGYELLPRFSPMDETGEMPLLVNYSLREGKVTVFIRLDPLVERRLSSFSPSSAGAP